MSPTPRFRFIFLLFSFAGLANAQVKPLGDVVRELREIHYDEKDFPLTEVSPLAQQLLSQMKQGLRQEITDAVEDPQTATATPQAIREAILRNLRANDVDIEPFDPEDEDCDPSSPFGHLLRLDVVSPEGYANLLAFQTTVSIPCGEDSSFYLFQREKSLWHLTIDREQNNYTSISDARGQFEFRFSPPDETGGWFVLLVDVNPWCSSNWQAIRYEVLRPSFSPDRPRVLLSEERGIYLGVEQPFDFSVRKDGFKIRQTASQSLDASLLTRDHVENYSVRGDHVARIPPYALRPEDFLDEWIELPWEEAKLLAASANWGNLKAWHEKLGQKGSNGFATEFDFVQPCPPEANASQWQIGLDLDMLSRPDWPARTPKEIFFTISKRGEDFLVVDVGATRPRGCPGARRPWGM